MPARPAVAEAWRLAGLGGLPEREVPHVVLVVLIGFDAFADALAGGIDMGQPAVGQLAMRKKIEPSSVR